MGLEFAQQPWNGSGHKKHTFFFLNIFLSQMNCYWLLDFLHF
jgi:hypothetical protein